MKSIGLVDNTVFFVGHYKDGKIHINKKIKPYVIFNKIAEENEPHNKNKYMYNDVRLCNAHGTIYCYDGRITSIYQIRVIDDNIYIPTTWDEIDNEPIYKKMSFYHKDNICSVKGSGKYFKSFDKNWSLVDVVGDGDDRVIEFLNWYRDEYVTNILYDGKSCVENKIIEMKKDLIKGIGDDDFPLFSFGTPFYKLENKNDNIVYDGIAVGHTKIRTIIEYNNPNINKFLDDMYDALLPYGKKYIEHFNFLYLCYFIRLQKIKNNDNVEYKMHISDSYLFLNKNKKYEDQYKFSIFFPMGIIVENDNVLVSAGEGDYYNCMLEFDLDSVLENTKHDVEYFDKSKYEFKLVKYT